MTEDLNILVDSNFQLNIPACSEKMPARETVECSVVVGLLGFKVDAKTRNDNVRDYSISKSHTQ